MPFILLVSCNNDEPSEKLKGQLGISISTTGTIDPGHKYLVTFSGLVGDLEIPNGIELGPNADTVIEMNRVGERLSIYLSNIPDTCPNVSSTSSTKNQLGFNTNPSDDKHPEAQYQSIFLIPLDGSVGMLEFEVGCN